MCGRFTTSIDFEALERYFKITRIEGEYKPLYNAAPSQDVPVILGNSPRILAFYKWGLIPSWANDQSFGAKLFNARSETLSEKPSFRNSFLHKRCLIPADSFFEWKHEGKTKTPFRFKMKDSSPFAMAALWDSWTTPENRPIHSCTVITTEANCLVKTIHDRMPVILARQDYTAWLDNSLKDTAILSKMLKPYPDELMSYDAADLSKLF